MSVRNKNSACFGGGIVRNSTVKFGQDLQVSCVAADLDLTAT